MSPASPGSSPSVLLAVFLQFDPQDLRDFFLDLYQSLGPLRPRLKPSALPLQHLDLIGQGILPLGQRPPLSRRPLLFSPLTLFTPLGQIRRVHPLTPKKGPNLTTTLASLRFP